MGHPNVASSKAELGDALDHLLALLQAIHNELEELRSIGA
jgi:hypothetical protein